VHKTIAIPCKYLQPVTAARTKQKLVPAETVFSYRFTYPLGQTIKSAAHVRCLGPRPDARPCAPSRDRKLGRPTTP
jgi:hypothetical protein